jgi:hypothetical protein
MKALFWIGLIIVILGVASLFVPIPRHDTEGIRVGDVSLGIEVRRNEKIPPALAAVMIMSGIGAMIATRSRK